MARTRVAVAPAAPVAPQASAPAQPQPADNGNSRREEILAIAATLFAEKGVRATTVRHIADAAGILSGSLYHHFSSKEAIVDELLRTFLDELFAEYDQIVSTELPPRDTLEQLVRASYRAIHTRRDQAAIYQDEVKHLRHLARFSYINERSRQFRQLWVGVLEAGKASGDFRADLDTQLTFRFLRDTVWVAVRWYRPGGTLGADTVANQYLSIVLDGIAVQH